MSKLIDSKNKHNNTTNFDQRLICLHLWDCFVKSDKDCNPYETYMHYLQRNGKGEKYTKESADPWVKKIKKTSLCIERAEYLPLA